MTEARKTPPKSKKDYAIQIAPSRFTTLTKPISSTDLALRYSLPLSIGNPSPLTCPSPQINPSPQTQKNPSRPQTPLSYAKIASPQSPQPISPQSKYIDKPNAKIMDRILEPFQIEEKMNSSRTTYKSPILSKIFPPHFNFYPDNPQKSRIFYEFILVDTDSVEITHIHDSKDKSRVAYSKAKILKVLSSENWKQKEWTEKSFSQPFEPKSFDYNDYQNAWYNTFFVRAFDHSWFIFFSPHFEPKNLPNWFHIWWKTFGALPEILPLQVQENFQEFERQYRNPPTCLHFMFHNQIPWILSWWFTIQTMDSIPFLFKKFKIKWWQNFKHSESPKQSQESLRSEDFPPLPNKFKSKKEYRSAIKLAFQNLSDSEEEEGEASTSQLQENEDDCYGLDLA